MKKLVYLATLLVVVAVSFAFLPKADEPKGVMMMVLKSWSSGGGTLTTVSPTGEVQSGQVKIDRKSELSSRTQFHQTELLKINELRQQGWTITHQHAVAYTEKIGVVSETTIEKTYLLEQR